MKDLIKLSLLSLLITSFLFSCATRKRKGEVSGFKKFYHNVTAKYNGYFNANEIMEDTYTSIEDAHQDNFNDILPVYPFTEIDPKNYESDMDKAIEKVTTVATIHDVSDWVDDCYVLMGTAQFIKQDYEAAQETFEFFQEEFNPNDPSSRNYKKKGKTAEDRRKEREEERKIELEKKKKEREAKQKAREEEIERRKKEQERQRKEKERKAEERKRKIEARKKAAREGRGAKRRAAKRAKKRAEKAAKADSTAQVDNKPIAAKPAKVNDRNEEKPKIAEDNAEVYNPKERKEEKVEIENTAYHEGILWLCRTYIERQRYSSADFLLRQMWDNPAVKKEVRKEIPAAQAHSYLKQKEYDKAKQYLMIATEIADDKKDRARYAYIIAQLEERNRNFSSAREYYARSKKLGSEYEMELNAELNMIKNDLLAKSISNRKGQEKLLDMRSENKNEEYRDRISFVLAEVAMAQPDVPKAEKYLKEALQYAKNNNDLAAEAYYSLGQILYDRDDFVNAKYYFDSTLQVIRKNDPRYDEVSSLANSLKDIAENIEMIELQDSLLRIGQLSRDEQIAYAKEVLKQEKNKNSAGSNIEKEDRGSISSKIRRAKKSRSRNLLQSDFFAYNQNEVKRGKELFKEKWGDRALQDNWRRKEALRVSADIRDVASNDLEDDEDEENQDAAIQSILDKIPTDPTSVRSAKAKIENAYFELGKLYRDDLKNYEESINAHETLLARFPETSKKLEVYYNLHLTYLEIPDMVNAEKYKRLIVKEFPDTKFAKVLSDPAYAAALMDKDRSLNNYYDEMYQAFEQGEFDKVLGMIENGEKKFGTNHNLRPKFGLLQAMAIGKTKGEAAYISSLQDVVKRYPRTPEQSRAREILRFLKGDESAFEAVDIDAVNDLFEDEEQKLHYLVVIVYGASPELFDETKIAVSDFNKKYHAAKRLQLADIPLNKSEKTSIILVRKFSNKEKGLNYYQDVIKRKSDFIPNNEVNYDVYAITQRNYRKMLEQRSPKQYRIWFERNYLANKSKTKK